MKSENEKELRRMLTENHGGINFKKKKRKTMVKNDSLAVELKHGN